MDHCFVGILEAFSRLVNRPLKMVVAPMVGLSLVGLDLWLIVNWYVGFPSRFDPLLLWLGLRLLSGLFSIQKLNVLVDSEGHKTSCSFSIILATWIFVVKVFHEGFVSACFIPIVEAFVRCQSTGGQVGDKCATVKFVDVVFLVHHGLTQLMEYASDCVRCELNICTCFDLCNLVECELSVIGEIMNGRCVVHIVFRNVEEVMPSCFNRVLVNVGVERFGMLFGEVEAVL